MTAQAHPHGHEVELETALDFVNTLELEGGEPVDHLSNSNAAIAWLAAHGLVHPELCADDDHRILERVRAVREALRTVVDALAEDRVADPAALATVNRTLARRDAVELVPAPEGARVGHRHVGDPVDGALARLADPLVGLVAEGDIGRLRICANDRCRWVFYDTSRTGRRRWCDMATCGNRAKAARHRARTKGETA
ncbi:MAG TPA: CGNR zinc finger domain-containing protein [Candidatus Limnocylindrales bacterium]|nr:CGNR zinc finger domain-containing protein [Candidatus Limnocylindrales bacterium]